MIRRLIYLGYYVKTLDRAMLDSFMGHAMRETGMSRTRLWIGMIRDSLVHNISLLEYFQFGFHRGLSEDEKRSWAGTGTMYEYHRVMNPPGAREILDDKTLFCREYRPFVRHLSLTIDDLEHRPELSARLLESPRLVLKESKGKCGRGTAFADAKGFTPASLAAHMRSEGFDLAEVFIRQHSDLDRLSPSGVNTVRIVTQLDERGGVDILACRQRISVDSPVDNLAAGNIAAPIDPQTGRIAGPAVYSDITKEEVDTHPVTGVPIVGFQVPYWEACLELARRAALHRPQNRSIGWDIVITEEGPGLIEGNHDWCKLLWQLPVGQGLKGMLDPYLQARP